MDGVLIKKVNGVICDLVFGSQVSGAITSIGLPYRAFRALHDIEHDLEKTDPGKAGEVLWIVNLAAKTATEPNIVDAALPRLIASGAHVVCYAPHVEEARMAWASGIGAKIVVPRGALISTIGELMAAQ
jgi:hypothetical protein